MEEIAFGWEMTIDSSFYHPDLGGNRSHRCLVIPLTAEQLAGDLQNLIRS